MYSRKKRKQLPSFPLSIKKTPFIKNKKNYPSNTTQLPHQELNLGAVIGGDGGKVLGLFSLQIKYTVN